MRVFSNFISYLLHPLFIPIAGTIAYFLITPKYTPLEVQSASIGVGSLLMYLINLSIHFEINLIIAISIFIFFTGAICTARLYLQAHTRIEIIIGLFVGILSQLLTVKFWL